MTSNAASKKRKLLDMLNVGSSHAATDSAGAKLPRGTSQATQRAAPALNQPQQNHNVQHVVVAGSGGFYRDPLAQQTAGFPATVPIASHSATAQPGDHSGPSADADVLTVIQSAIEEFPQCSETEGCIPFTLLTIVQACPLRLFCIP